MANPESVECTCNFHGLCTCDGALEFMRCIGVTCASGGCKCEEARFAHACKAMSSTCKSVGLECGLASASCRNSWGAMTNVSWGGPGQRHTAEELSDLHGLASAGVFNNTNSAIVYTFMFTIVLLAIVFAMATTQDEVIRSYTLYMIDQVVSVFLAVLYFSAMDSVLELYGIEQDDKRWIAIVNTVIIFVLALFIAHVLRKQEVYLGIFCAAGAHFVGFTALAAAEHHHEHVLVERSDYHWMRHLGLLGALGLVFMVAGFLTHKAKLAAGADEDFMDKTDELEQDASALAFSVVWTLTIQLMITGVHKEHGHSDAHENHTAKQRLIMLIYAFASIVAAGIMVRICSLPYFGDDASYFVRRIAGFLATVASMNVAWAWLFWGEWQFFDTVFEGEPVVGNIVWSITATFFSALTLICLSRIPQSHSSKEKPKSKSTSDPERSAFEKAVRQVKKLAKPRGFAHERKVALTALALIVAFSWEGSFDTAVDEMCKGRSAPHQVKVACTLVMSVILLPVWALYLRPLSGPALEEIESGHVHEGVQPIAEEPASSRGAA